MKDPTDTDNLNHHSDIPELTAILSKLNPRRVWTEGDLLVLAASEDHPDTLKMFEFLNGKLPSTERSDLLKHLANCDYCLQEVASLGQFMHPDGLKPRMSRQVVEMFTTAVERLVEPMRPSRAQLAFDSDNNGNSMLRQPLQFADNRALGTFMEEDGRYKLHIEHQDWQAGTLVLVELTSPENETILQCFAAMKEDWDRTSIDMEVDAFEADKCLIELRKVDAAKLPEEAAESLKIDFERSVEADPASRPAWAILANSVNQTTTAEAVNNVLEMMKRQADSA